MGKKSSVFFLSLIIIFIFLSFFSINCIAAYLLIFLLFVCFYVFFLLLFFKLIQEKKKILFKKVFGKLIMDSCMSFILCIVSIGCFNLHRLHLRSSGAKSIVLHKTWSQFAGIWHWPVLMVPNQPHPYPSISLGTSIDHCCPLRLFARIMLKIWRKKFMLECNFIGSFIGLIFRWLLACYPLQKCIVF